MSFFTGRHLCAALVFGLFFIDGAAAAELEYQQARRFFETRAYAQCAQACGRGMQSATPESRAALYELRSDCLEGLGNGAAAAQCLQQLLALPDVVISDEDRARLSLKIGNILRRAGLLSRARTQYLAVAATYETMFPDRFAHYARTNAAEIDAQQRALVSGRVCSGWWRRAKGAAVQVVNGFETAEGTCDADGRFSVPLYGSTPGTQFAVMLTRAGYLPLVRTMRFDGAERIALGDLRHNRKIENGAGVIAGIVGMPVSGGKRRPRRGFGEFVGGHTIRLWPADNVAAEPRVCVADSAGAFALEVAPGDYLVDDGFRRHTLSVAAGQTALLAVKAPGKLVD